MKSNQIKIGKQYRVVTSGKGATHYFPLGITVKVVEDPDQEDDFFRCESTKPVSMRMGWTPEVYQQWMSADDLAPLPGRLSRLITKVVQYLKG